MDRRIIAIAFIILLCTSSAWGRMGMMVVGGSGGDVQTCESSPFKSVTGSPGSGFNVGSTSALVYVGQAIATGQSSYNLCGIKFRVRAIAGDISSKNYHAEVWSTSNGNRLSIKATSNTLSGLSFTSGQLTSMFEFSPSVSLDATDAVVIKEETGIDGTNYVQMGYLTVDSDSGYSSSSIYNSSGVSTNYSTRDMIYELYKTN